MNYNDLTAAVLLKADPISQDARITLDNETKSLVSEEQFWGAEGLFYNFFQEQKELGYSIPRDGWDDYANNEKEKLTISQTLDWINYNLFSPKENNLCVIQGYAGCGKTIFVNAILRRRFSNTKDSYYNFYIGHIKNVSESYFIRSAILSGIVKQITNALLYKDGMEIYEKFIGFLADDLSELSTLSNYADVFNSKTEVSLYKSAEKLHTYAIEKREINEEMKDFRIKFIGAIRRGATFLTPMNESGLLGDILLIDLLWRSAVCNIRNYDKTQILVYDNMDIIEDHQIVADFVDVLRSVLFNFENFNTAGAFPIFKAIICIRKITYASVSSHFLEVEEYVTRQNMSSVFFLDISNLYKVSKIIKHKSQMIYKNIGNFIPDDSSQKEEIEQFLNIIMQVPDDIFSEVDVGDFFNHNIRACINMLEKIIEKYPYQKKMFTQRYDDMPDKLKSAAWKSAFCSILKANDVWVNLGYNLDSSQKIHYPTTLSRMILTYLYNRRIGNRDYSDKYPSTDVSLKEIVLALETLPFGVYDIKQDWEKEVAPQLSKEYNPENTREKIATSIAYMLQRNSRSDCFELWRRPMFYTCNTFPLSNPMESKKILMEQIKNFGLEDNKVTSFCITDGGYTFIEKFATHFEFYSVRFNSLPPQPLCYILDSKTMEETISIVFSEVSKCADKQIWLMRFYSRSNENLKRKYMKEFFHPRTLYFAPQLHIVRTIYGHISYLNDYRDYLHGSYKNNRQVFDPLNRCLLKWIGKYLELYKSCFFEILKDTDEQYNNDVWEELNLLYKQACIDEKANNRNFVSISRE